MFKAQNLLLIDGNNLCHRVFWTHRDLSYEGTPVGLIYGFYRSLIALKKKYPDHFCIIAWDSKSKRRIDESEAAVERGLIPSAYKANRKRDKDDEMSEDFESLFEQMDVLKESLEDTKVFQVRMEGYEADDVIYTYAMQNAKAGGESTIITSDKDFYQLLENGVKLYDPLNDQMWTRERFTEEFGFSPDLWVEVGSIMGDKSDNIFGVDGWGMKTTAKYIREHGSLDKIVKFINEKKKKGKREEKLLVSMDIIALAKSLKQMDIVPFVPRLRFTKNFDKKKVDQFFLSLRFGSLIQESWRLT